MSVDEARRAIEDAADDELDTAIATLHSRERELLVAADSEAAFELMSAKCVLLSTLKNRRRCRTESPAIPDLGHYPDVSETGREQEG